MFITELKGIYSNKPFLSNIVPYHEIAPQLELFINQEVRLGSRYLNPYRFAFKFGYNPKDIINLFIAFSSKGGPLKRFYRFECGECEELHLLDDDQFKNLKCPECGYDGDIENIDFLDNVKVVFEIKEPFLKEVQRRLKDQASSERKTKLKPQKTSDSEEASLKSVMDSTDAANESPDEDFTEMIKQVKSRLSSGLRK
ncbi:hypothetical protein M3221_13785 [Domibacillus indicus]|uniref:hypothetical protein n=1 Tax=Domibacillus indicus TaxID=1437523 RepID=UPI00203D74C7|nr:hypothetical protein [Domibacillus indicus]MCM3789472.1 hypothetical protein [Domibacillus indicus]